MASKKKIKKDINFLVDEVIATCLLQADSPEGKPNKNLDGIIEEMLIFREEMIYKVNNPELNENNKSLKKYYNDLYEHLIKHVNEVFEKIN